MKKVQSFAHAMLYMKSNVDFAIPETLQLSKNDGKFLKKLAAENYKTVRYSPYDRQWEVTNNG